MLIQEYEQFEAKADESLTKVYDRFLSLLNELSLVGKVYDYEDSNTKFLRALSEDWDTQTSIIRHQYDLNEISLDEIYGMLKTCDMELQQRKNKKSNLNKRVALKVDSRSSGSMKGKAGQHILMSHQILMMTVSQILMTQILMNLRVMKISRK